MQLSSGPPPNQHPELGTDAGPPQALHSEGVGSFRFWFATGRWEWSPQVYAMHGYQPGEVEPTTALLLAHKHPDDRDQVAETIAVSIREGRPLSSRHRFLDTTGREHQVLLVSDAILDEHETPIGTAGYYIDLSDTIATAERDALNTVMPEVIEARATIEQAKGVLMYMYAISAEQAFKILIWRSQETNTKLRQLAEAFLSAVPQLPAPPTASVTVLDHLLLTVHEQIPRAETGTAIAEH
ncbi:PAS and ANTAR domain-containing protein [Nocardia sp. NPDC050435]|uniref:PAS and ANTAR domain-containing protein n=1 Tax=Nocardia sp. NPDC050435 TaxID=3155040 RepID=UPI0033CC939E